MRRTGFIKDKIKYDDWFKCKKFLVYLCNFRRSRHILINHQVKEPCFQHTKWRSCVYVIVYARESVFALVVLLTETSLYGKREYSSEWNIARLYLDIEGYMNKWSIEQWSRGLESPGWQFCKTLINQAFSSDEPFEPSKVSVVRIRGFQPGPWHIIHLWTPNNYILFWYSFWVCH